MTVQRLKIQRFCDDLLNLLKSETKTLLNEGQHPTAFLQRVYQIKDEAGCASDEQLPEVAERLEKLVSAMRENGIVTAERWQKYLTDD